MKKLLSFLILFFFSYSHHVYLRDQSSTVKVSEVATIKIEEPVEDFGGTLEIDKAESIVGEVISLLGGIFQHAGNQAKVTAKVSDTKIFLDGEKKFKGDGSRMTHSLRISGTGNILEGEVIPSDDIEIVGSDSDVTFAVTSKIDKDISLDGSKLTLDSDLVLGDGNRIKGNGTVNLNKRRLVMGALPVTWDAPIYFDNASDITMKADTILSSTWTFSGGANIIDGSSNTLSLKNEGTILVEKGSTLLFKNMRIDGIHKSTFDTLDTAASVTLSNVAWIQDGDYQLDHGCILIKDKVRFIGPYKFVYRASNPLCIAKNAKLIIDRNMTFSYDPLTINTELLQCEDKSSLLHLKNGTLHITTTGLKLTKGALLVDGQSKIVSELLYGEFPADVVSGGLEIGDGTEANDMKCIISQGSSLELVSGDITYNNYAAESWDMLTVNSLLKLATGTRLILEKDMNIDDGRVQLSPGSAILQNNGARLIGSREMLKS